MKTAIRAGINSAEDMQKIINGAMEFKSYHTTYGNSVNMWIKGMCESFGNRQD